MPTRASTPLSKSASLNGRTNDAGPGLDVLSLFQKCPSEDGI